MRWGKHIAALAVLTALFLTAGGAGSAVAGFDQNEEIQDVMGDLSALKTAAQMHYSDNGNNPRVPPLSLILRYFDEGTLPPDASSLYAIKGNSGGWYVGYKTYGLKSETYRLLEENANSLEILGDNLRSPWRRDSAYIWLGALMLENPSSTAVIRESSSLDTAIGITAILFGAAAFIDAVNHRSHRHHRGHHYYNTPSGHRWRSSLTYHPSHQDRFYNRFSQPVYRPGKLAPHHRESPRLRRDSRRGAPRLPVQKAPAQKQRENRRPNIDRPHSHRR